MFTPISNNTKNFLISLFSLETPQREDNRSLDSFRNINIKRLTDTFNSPYEIKIGNTTIISQIYCKLVSPYIDKPNEGIINFSIDTNYLRFNSEYYSSNEELTDFRINISNYLEKSLKETKALDSNSLCVIPGKLVWKITLDLNLINYDGNALDAFVISSLITWCTYKIPFIRLKNNEIYFNNFLYLTTIFYPISVTFGIFFDVKKNKNIFICDYNLLEEKVLNGTISVCANIFNEICYLQLKSSVSVSKEEISDLMVIVSQRISEIHKIIKINVEKEKRKEFNFDTIKENLTFDENCIFLEKNYENHKNKKQFNILTYNIEK